MLFPEGTVTLLFTEGVVLLFVVLPVFATVLFAFPLGTTIELFPAVDVEVVPEPFPEALLPPALPDPPEPPPLLPLPPEPPELPPLLLLPPEPPELPPLLLLPPEPPDPPLLLPPPEELLFVTDPLVLLILTVFLAPSTHLPVAST